MLANKGDTVFINIRNTPITIRVTKGQIVKQTSVHFGQLKRHYYNLFVSFFIST